MKKLEIIVKGERGSGKTYILSIIAETLLNKGFLVGKKTADQETETLTVINDK